MKLWLLTLAGLWAMLSAMAADALANREITYRIAFEFVSDDPKQHESLLNKSRRFEKRSAEVIRNKHPDGLTSKAGINPR